MSDVARLHANGSSLDLELLKIAFAILENEQRRASAQVPHACESTQSLVSAAHHVVNELYSE